MLANRLIACFDVKDGRVTKAQQFQDNIDVGDPAELADRLYHEDVDEIVIYDIMASAQKRQIDLAWSAGGAPHVRAADGRRRHPAPRGHAPGPAGGAEKISIDSMAVRNPQIITQGSVEFGRQCIVLSMQVKRVEKTASDPQRLRDRHRRRPHVHRHGRGRVGQARAGPRGRRDRGEQHRPRRHGFRVRPGHHRADHRGGVAAGHRLGRGRPGQPRGGRVPRSVPREPSPARCCTRRASSTPSPSGR